MVKSLFGEKLLKGATGHDDIRPLVMNVVADLNGDVIKPRPQILLQLATNDSVVFLGNHRRTLD